MWRDEGLPRWFGNGTRIHCSRSARCTLCDEAGPWRRGRVISAKPRRLVLELQPAVGWNTTPDFGSTVTLRLEETAERRCELHIEERGLPAELFADASFFWTTRLQRLRTLERQVVRRRDRARQAVVVIHGIGEQQPGVTLRNLLASGVFGDVPASEIWVKPDRLSRSFDLRSAVLKASFAENRPSTEVYELYWAHVIRDTTASQVGAWARKLLTKRDAPRALLPIRVVLWGLLVVLAAFAVAAWWLGLGWMQWLLAGGAFVTAAWLVVRLVSRHLFIDIVGDAARYLLPLPANVAHRQRIREMGVDLLEKLHASQRFDRIVVLGHSLGSVIAYDVITHAWSRYHREHENPERSSFQELRELEKNLQERDVDAAQTLQHAVWRRLRQNTQPWLVTDLVTVGSPLTYADFLVASDREEFERNKKERSLPTCPPEPETERKTGHSRVSFEHAYGDTGRKSRRTFTFLHHGAPFAAVRWTNLYFQARRLGFVGDLVGGPLAPLFGHWVRDVPMTSPKSGITHTWYWRPKEVNGPHGAHGAAEENQHIAELSRALALDHRRELTALLQEIPSYLLLDEPLD